MRYEPPELFFGGFREEVHYVLDDDGVPLPCPDLEAWAEWAFPNDPALQLRRRGVAQTRIRKYVSVSTVFLALDHGFGRGAPVLWETMIFGGPHDGYQDRYSTREDAEAGHREAVRLARSAPRKVRASKGWRRYVRRAKAARLRSANILAPRLRRERIERTMQFSVSI